MSGSRIALALASLLAAAACSSSNSGPADASAPEDSGTFDACAPLDSSCGQPCTGGNSLGVGQYCSGILDCSGTPQAHLCSDLGDPTTHFCTFRCSLPVDAGSEGGLADGGGSTLPTDCGEGASCTCDKSGECGCTPNACLGP